MELIGHPQNDGGRQPEKRFLLAGGERTHGGKLRLRKLGREAEGLRAAVEPKLHKAHQRAEQQGGNAHAAQPADPRGLLLGGELTENGEVYHTLARHQEHPRADLRGEHGKTEIRGGLLVHAGLFDHARHSAHNEKRPRERLRNNQPEQIAENVAGDDRLPVRAHEPPETQQGEPLADAGVFDRGGDEKAAENEILHRHRPQLERKLRRDDRGVEQQKIA